MKYISINLIIALSKLYLKCFTIETYVIYFKWESHLLNKTIQKPNTGHLLEHLSCACTCTFHSYLFYTWKSVESILKHCKSYHYDIKNLVIIAKTTMLMSETRVPASGMFFTFIMKSIIPDKHYFWLILSNTWKMF